MTESNARVVVTGTAWMGTGIGSIESAIGDLFRDATDEIIMAAYSISTGSDLTFRWLESALTRGVQVTLIVDAFNHQPADVVGRLSALAVAYDHFRLFDFQGDDRSALHAKAIVADRKVALIGSSNMSRRGLLVNYELAVLVNGPAASITGQTIDALIGGSLVRRI